MGNEITVEKSRLLAALNDNMKTHKEKVDKAREVYRSMIIEELDNRLAEAKSGRDIDPGFLNRLPIPRDFTKEYEQAIAMYEWELAPQILLSRQDFQRFVLDDWEWNQQFVASSSFYLAS